MKQNQQFNQASSSMHEFCTVYFLAKLMIWINALYICAAALTAYDYSQWMQSLHLNLIWLEPALIVSLPFLCIVSQFAKFRFTSMCLTAVVVSCAMAYWILDYLGTLNDWSLVRAVCVGLSIAALCEWQKRQSYEEDVEPVVNAATLQSLGAAIRPHFFFNALNAVMVLIRINPKSAESILQDTADLFRDVMNQGQQRLVTVTTELNTVRRYVRIEQARLEGRLIVKWHVDTGLSEALIPPFTLQPLVENAIRHGIEGMELGGEVKISIIRVDKDIRISVINPWSNAVTVQEGRKKIHNGIALKNLEERLKLMYHKAANMVVHRSSEQYVVSVRLPLEF